MDRSVEGDCGGIRALRLLIEGEFAGAINTDLRCNNFPGVDWAGTVRLSWWELAEFLRWLPGDRTSALYRARNPDDWMWDFDRLLAAATATAVSDLRWLEVVGRVGEDDVPDRWRLRVYGPPDPEDEDRAAGSVEAEQEARTAAASIRG